MLHQLQYAASVMPLIPSRASNPVTWAEMGGVRRRTGWVSALTPSGAGLRTFVALRGIIRQHVHDEASVLRKNLWPKCLGAP